MANELVPYQAPSPPALIDSRGRPLRPAAELLTREVAAPTIAGIRSIFTSHPAQGLDPYRLSNILLQAEQGNANAYLELAEEMEEKDLHYQSVLGTRKRAVAQLPIEVEAAGEGADYEGDAQLIRDWLKRLTLQGELFDILDAIGKGYSATEIVWKLASNVWLPETLKFRDPRFFEFDRVRGEDLLLKGGADGTSGLPEPLTPYKYIVHQAPAKTGLAIRGGLARAVAWMYLFKNFTLKDWLTFLEVYGLPLRVGKYQNGTSEDDIRRLAAAVAQIGSDAGAVIPQSMMIEFITSAGGTANPEMFQSLCIYADDQVSKATLGQTSSSDAKAGGLGSGQANLHGDVRDDLKDADAAQLSATLTRDLSRPMVMFNRGVRDKYPIIRIGRPDNVDVAQALDMMERGVKLGVPIAVSTYRKLTGMAEPKAGEPLLAAPAAQSPQEGEDGAAGREVPENGDRGFLGPLKPPRRRVSGRVANDVAAALADFIDVAAKYNPSQPRRPRGSPRGGEWGGGASIGAAPAAIALGSAAPKLSAGERATVSAYSLMDYKTINEHARGEADHGDVVRRKIEVMDGAVSKGRLGADAVLYRSVSGPGVDALKRAGLSEGSILQDPGFMSTSRSRDIATSNFGEARGSILIAIAAKKGVKALDVAKFSAVSFEEEVVLPRSSKLRVTKWDKKTRTLHMETVDD